MRYFEYIYKTRRGNTWITPTGDMASYTSAFHFTRGLLKSVPGRVAFYPGPAALLLVKPGYLGQEQFQKSNEK